MNKKKRRLPDGELMIMQIVWDKEPPVARSAIEKELTGEKQLAPSTIITFLNRLCEKGFLSLERNGRTNYYTPLISRRAYLAQESRNILDRLYGGSLASFATALCDSGISREELEALRELLERGML
ncbi:BlaI/MecI/CopY family transcriptional regulator [Lachnospiraceae bacterium 47-T17]